MPYWDHKKAIGFAGGLFAVPIYPPCTPIGGLRGVPLRRRAVVTSFPPPCTPDGGLRGVPLRLPESAEGLRVGYMNFTCPQDPAPGGHNGIFVGQAR